MARSDMKTSSIPVIDRRRCRSALVAALCTLWCSLGRHPIAAEEILRNDIKTVFIVPSSHWDVDFEETFDVYKDMASQNILSAMDVIRDEADFRFTIENVIFVKSQISTMNILSVIDVFMFTPERKEGLGLVLLEALASGKPIVATNVGGISSIVKDGVNGFLVEPCNSEQLADRIQFLLDRDELRATMSKTGRKMVEDTFSWDAKAMEISKTYETLLANRS